ncbi:MAG: hypothetical protein ACOVOR_01440 [Rhabdochlamydiaceae bacterium]
MSSVPISNNDRVYSPLTVFQNDTVASTYSSLPFKIFSDCLVFFSSYTYRNLNGIKSKFYVHLSSIFLYESFTQFQGVMIDFSNSIKNQRNEMKPARLASIALYLATTYSLYRLINYSNPSLSKKDMFFLLCNTLPTLYSTDIFDLGKEVCFSLKDRSNHIDFKNVQALALSILNIYILCYIGNRLDPSLAKKNLFLSLFYVPSYLNFYPNSMIYVAITSIFYSVFPHYVFKKSVECAWDRAIDFLMPHFQSQVMEFIYATEMKLSAPWVQKIFNHPEFDIQKTIQFSHFDESESESGAMSCPSFSILEYAIELNREDDIKFLLTEYVNDRQPVDCLINDALAYVLILDHTHPSDHLKEIAKLLINHSGFNIKKSINRGWCGGNLLHFAVHKKNETVINLILERCESENQDVSSIIKSALEYSIILHSRCGDDSCPASIVERLARALEPS